MEMVINFGKDDMRIYGYWGNFKPNEWSSLIRSGKLKDSKIIDFGRTLEKLELL